VRRLDEEVLQVEPRRGQEGRVVVEEEREGDRAAVHLREEDLGVGPRAEEMRAEPLRAARHLVGQTLVLREAADQAEDVVDVGRRGAAEGGVHGAPSSTGRRSGGTP
jgi:hypothetical protein